MNMDSAHARIAEAMAWSLETWHHPSTEQTRAVAKAVEAHMVEEICVALGAPSSEAEVDALVAGFRQRYTLVSGLAYAPYLEKPAGLVGVYGLGQLAIAACITRSMDRAWTMVAPTLPVAKRIIEFYARTSRSPIPADLVRPFELGVKVLVTIPRHIDAVPGLAKSMGIRREPPEKRAPRSTRGQS